MSLIKRIVCLFYISLQAPFLGAEDLVNQPNISSERAELLAPQPETVASEPPVAQPTVDTQAPTYSCSIHFPLDSVQFSEQRMEECFTGIDPKTISYIHIIATASPEGTSEHNLYLSTRRAGALEGYLRNRFPDTVIHAFGAGVNPKTGKMARVIIVTQTPQVKPLEAAVVYKPEVVTKIEKVTETRYKDRAPSGWTMLTSSGITSGERAYHFVSVAGTKSVPWMNIKNLSLGAKYSVLRSNRRMDIISTSAFISKGWQITKLRYDSALNFNLSSGVSFLTQHNAGSGDGLSNANNQVIDPGAGVGLDLVKSIYILSLEAQFSGLFQAFGIGFGVTL